MNYPNNSNIGWTYDNGQMPGFYSTDGVWYPCIIDIPNKNSNQNVQQSWN